MMVSNEMKNRMNDRSYCLFGAKTLKELLKDLDKQVDGAKKGDDTEYIHKMRVSSRRIRVAMSLFRYCFPRKRFKRWRKEIKNITRSLGMARDMDVQIAFVESYLNDLSDEQMRPCMELLLSRYKERRAAIQPDVINALNELGDSDVVREMLRASKDIIKEAKGAPADSPALYMETHKHIYVRLNDLLALEDCVHHEDEVLKHHKMRIAAKRLRYTMEVFRTIYDDGFGEQISILKKLQDVLGDMHDFDVWIEYIPHFIEEVKGEPQSNVHQTEDRIKDIESGLLRFREDIRERRRSLYSNFVALWQETKDKGMIERIEKIIDPMPLKIAIIADEHGNLHALESVMKDANNRGIEFFLNAGDFVGFGAFPDKIVKELRSSYVLSVIGNFDLKVIKRKEGKKSKKSRNDKEIAYEYARENLSKSSIRYLRSLPEEMRLNMGGRRLLIVHGSPESIEEHLMPDTPEERLRQLATAARADIIIVGNSHLQFSRTVDGVTFINPGSVGRPDDGDPRAAYAVLTFDPFSIDLIRIDYDVEAAADAIRQKRLPESFAQMLLRGVSLKTILEEEKAKKRLRDTSWDMETDIEKVMKAREKYGMATVHPDQVRRLALRLFDELRILHVLGSEERYWLECAAILHDIGWSCGGKGHNKTSLRLILNDTDLPFTSRERYIIGSIARYHRKGPPKEEHYNFVALSLADRHKVMLLSSLIRIADGLDASQSSIVRDIKVRTGSRKVIIECSVYGNMDLEEEAINGKKDMFEKLFKKELIIRRILANSTGNPHLLSPVFRTCQNKFDNLKIYTQRIINLVYGVVLE